MSYDSIHNMYILKHNCMVLKVLGGTDIVDVLTMRINTIYDQ